MAVGYTDHIVGRVASLVAVCTHRVSRATRRLLRHRLRYGVSGGRAGAPRRKKQPAGAAPRDVTGCAAQQQTGGIDADGKVGEGEGEGEGIWRRAILMGERCQPLDFAGAIHYDSFGRRLARPPTPRSASSLSCRSSDSLATYLETTEV